MHFKWPRNPKLHLTLKLHWLLLAGLFLVKINPVAAQDFQSQRLQFTGYNIGFNALVGGVGAAINKKPDQTLGNAFLKGMGKGALGGLLIHTAKASVYQIYKREQYGWAWPARLTNALGSSIVQNAAANRGMLDRLHLNLWMVRADYNFKEQQFLLRLVPSEVVGAFYFSRFGNLSLSKSLKTGLVYYDIPFDVNSNSSTYGHSMATAIAVGTPYYFDEFFYYEVVAHEVLHNLQYESAVWLNPYFDKIDSALKQRSGFYKTVARFIYLDANLLATSPLRQIKAGGDCHFSRFTEREAQHYAIRSHIDCEDDYSGIGFLLKNE